MRTHNFNAGPGILPDEVIQESSKAILNFENTGMGILEISHRSKEFEKVIQEAQELVKELYGLSNEYSVLFLQGGASLQFAMVPMNLLNEGESAAYLQTGEWAQRAIKEAKLFGKVNVVGDSSDKNYSYIPKNLNIPSDSKYFHITTNNTIFGTQIQEIPKSPVSYIADMSSDIFSRKIDANQFDLIYAGAQKNMGPAGTTLVIIKESILGKVTRQLPTLLDYRTHIKNGSLYNTPSVFAIYVSMLTLRWIKKNGGVEGIEKANKEKADMLYKEIDNNPLFKGTAAKEDRSLMNITFISTKPELDEEFLKMCKAERIEGIKGHRSVGGFRASMYNALPIESVEMLVEVMQDFGKKHA